MSDKRLTVFRDYVEIKKITGAVSIKMYMGGIFIDHLIC